MLSLISFFSPVTKALFPSDDEHVLRFLYEENQRIEPEWYCPVIPVVLVNGAEGIGTGWSTKVPNYNPRDIVTNIRRLINGESQRPIVPWYKNFTGQIVQLDNNRFVCSGEIGILSDDSLEVTELPVKTWTQNYKESVIEPLLEANDNKGSDMSITDFKEYHTDVTVKFIVKMAQEKLRRAQHEGLHKVFKLQTVINTTSMVLFDANGVLRRFDTPEQICEEFFHTRKRIYIDRKRFLEGMLQAQSDRLSEQARFIMMKIENKIVIENKKKAQIIEQLVQANFLPDPVKAWKDLQRKRELEMCGEVIPEEDEDEENADDTSRKVSDYDYLVGMAMWKLSTEDKEKLLAESTTKKEELRTLQNKTWSDLWNEDLNTFMEALEKQEKKEQADIEEAIKIAAKKLAKDKAGAPARSAKKNAALFADVKPNPEAIRIEPTLDHMKEKYKEKTARAPKKAKTEGMDMRQFLEHSNGSNQENENSNGSIDVVPVDDNGDTLDAPEKKPLAEKEEKPKKKATKTEKKAPSAPKEKKTATEKPKKAAKPKKKKEESEEEDDVIELDEDEDSPVATPAKREHAPRRAAAASAKYFLDSEDEDLKDSPPAKKAKRVVISDDEDDFFV